ncbi:MAG TPA: peptidoglycan-binding domain-containing protein, partial [Microlunatus sp.]|nr:peptidoglycan-binding domain-containing protein [Microlunatus sp.]
MTTNTSTQNSTPKTSRRLVAAIVAGGVAIAGLTAAVTMTLETPSAHAQTTPPTSSSSGSDSHHASSTHGGQHHSHHAVTPSQSIKTLQSQLAQLNYYDGPISGYWNADTTNAVDYLQASAHLAQTGTMNTATQAALDYQLAHGDNQMGGNTNTPASPAIKTLQTQLAQLNYYDGAITGHMNTGTVHAVEYLQRAAGLPQTGSMDAATQTALT